MEEKNWGSEMNKKIQLEMTLRNQTGPLCEPKDGRIWSNYILPVYYSRLKEKKITTARKKGRVETQRYS